MAMSRDEIFEKIKVVLEEALGVDEDEMTLTASLTEDLGAESIDVLDIQFRLEKMFSTDDAPFKIGQGELFPENLMENPDWVQDGTLTDAGMEMLRERMSHVDFSEFENDRDVTRLAQHINVQSLIDFVVHKLPEAQG